jgi:hypothetical protein
MSHPWYDDDDSPEQIAADLEAARLAQMKQERDAMTAEQRLEVASFLLDGMKPSQSPAPPQTPAQNAPPSDDSAPTAPEPQESGDRWATTDDAALKAAARRQDSGAFVELLRRRIREAEQQAS